MDRNGDSDGRYPLSSVVLEDVPIALWRGPPKTVKRSHGRQFRTRTDVTIQWSLLECVLQYPAYGQDPDDLEWIGDRQDVSS